MIVLGPLLSVKPRQVWTYPRLGPGLLQRHGACVESAWEAAAVKLASGLCPSGICWQHWALPAAEEWLRTTLVRPSDCRLAAPVHLYRAVICNCDVKLFLS